ncbi:hypothetical protein NDU88_001848 [Pleurodeles waltl]|uniref:Uncharacterized protein n=1 Tax=Pleurodeles waltl TaxID=8319 RepID=A0AAV7LZT2_PLEWA|nr:hypothetical protein NDU88_001848 [Pleurodeles waltl]
MPITAPAVIEGSRAADGPGRCSRPKVQRRRTRSSKVRSKMGGAAAGRFRPAPLLKAVHPGSARGSRTPGRVSGLSPLRLPTGPNVHSRPAGIRQRALRAHRSRNGNGPRSAGRSPITEITAAPAS